MIRCLVIISVVACPLGALAQDLSADSKGFTFRQGDEFIRFDKGRWSAGIEGGQTLRWHMFLWHDEWVYETLPDGEIKQGPAVAADDAITMSGTFRARDGSAPVEYAYTIEPAEDGVSVRCELEKTGDLPLKSPGTWLHVSGSRSSFTGAERVWASPSWHSELGATRNGKADRFMVQLQGSRALCFELPGLVTVGSEGSQSAYAYRLNVLPGDFEVGQKAVAQYTIRFADMPDDLPGEVRPMKQPLQIGKVTPSADRVSRYDKFELTVELGATYDNPYDPDDVALNAVFTAPSGREVSVPGFFMVEHERRVEDGHEVMQPRGNGVWRVRFAPSEAGTYTWQLSLRDRSGQVNGGEGGFESVAGDGKGFVRVSDVDRHYLAFDSGEGFYPIGHNLPIYHTSGQLADEGMRKFAAAGENYNRWWMCSYGFGIEWEKRLGWYRQTSAAQIDLAMDWARELGLYYMMCMDTHQDFRGNGWAKNPFNSANGGPCNSPAEWFTDPTAREYYRKRLRYTVARWGYSPHVLCWEFGNEFEGWADSPNSVKLPWHREMSDYLRSIDPYGHLITTSFWGTTGPGAFWELPNIDIVQTHTYTNDDSNVAARVRDYSLHQWRSFDKPHIFGEFGIRSHSTTAEKDPEGWAIHNALWSGLLSFCAGPPAPWWHENYIDPLDLYFHFTALRNFAAGLPLGRAKWEPVDEVTMQFVDPNHEPETRDAVIEPFARWGKPEHSEFALLPDGTLADERRPQELLQGLGHEDIKNPPTFSVDYPRPGQFIVHVDTVSNSGLLRVWVDGRQELEIDLPCGEGLEKRSIWREEWELWETTYDKQFALDLPAGPHRIRIENFGKDWIRVGSYTFEGCRLMDKPNVLVCGMKTEGLAALWLQNRDSTWRRHAGDEPVAAVDEFLLTIAGVPDGEYELQWWDTWRGAPGTWETVRVEEGLLEVVVPALQTDRALKLTSK